MENYLRVVCCILICSVICLVLNKNGKDFSLVLIVFVCCVVVCGAVNYLKPVMELVDRLANMGQLNLQTYSVLLKVSGVTLIAEIASLVCKDAGADSLGKAMQILSVSVVLWLCIPLMNELLDLVDTVLGSV